MGHSSKAGENIFWAMNRNKPGIIKRILNALERFIARIRGKDAYLAVEQRQAAERLRDMLTGELKRAYGTEVKGEAAVESGGGKRHSLAGQYSQTAKLNSLSGAVRMNENGTPMYTIRARTGWWLGKDGKWRYEIDDSALSFDRNGYTDNAMYLADYVRHDKLFAAYPWLRGVKLKIVDVIAGNENLNGLYNHHNDTIYLKDGRTDKQMKSTLLHELQHVIQEYEGFATGANPNAAAALLLNSAYNDLKRDSRFAKIKSPDEKMRIVKQYIERTTDNQGTSETESSGRGVQRVLNEVSKPEKRFSLSSADTDIYSRIFDMQREETELTNRIREIEKSDAFKKANDDLSKAINNDNIAEGMKAYQAWRKESGYADLVDRRDALRAELEEIRTKANNLYDMFYNNTVDGKRLKKDERVDTMRIIEEMDKIVDAVIENAVGVDDTYVEMKKLLPELRNTKLVVPMDARADAAQSAGFENWAEFRKANFGRVGFANEGLPVDTYYMELSERYPELFPDGITHPGEQAAHIADVVNTIRESGINEYQLYDIEDERIRTSIKNDVMDIIGNAEKLQTFADRAAQKVEDTKLAEAMHYGADIAKLKRLNAEKVADIKAENRKRLSDMRRKYQDRVESVRERYAEARANRSEKQKQTVLRNKVLRKYTEASSMLDRPTTENHFTEAMREPIMEFLAAVDITTGKSVAKQGVYDRILRVIEAANNMAAEDGKNGLGIAETDLNVQEKQLIVDSGLLERMAAWVEANQGKKLTELSSAQLFDQIVSNEPPVGYVHLDLLQQPYFAADTVRISYEQHTEKNLRLDSRASVILAVIRLADSAGTSFSNTILSQA